MCVEWMGESRGFEFFLRTEEERRRVILKNQLSREKWSRHHRSRPRLSTGKGCPEDSFLG